MSRVATCMVATTPLLQTDMQNAPEPLSPDDVARITAEEQLRQQIRVDAQTGLWSERIRRTGMLFLLLSPEIGAITLLSDGAEAERACRNAFERVGEVLPGITTSEINDFVTDVRADVRMSEGTATVQCRAERTGTSWVATDFEVIRLHSSNE